MFPVFNTSPQVAAIKRLNRVMGRTRIGKRLIARASVFACKITVGTSLYSAHAFGKAVDLMLKVANREDAEDLRRAVVKQATKRTLSNRGRPIRGIRFVVGGNDQWVRGEGTSHYSGVPHDNHVHAATMGSTTTKPPCAR